MAITKISSVSTLVGQGNRLANILKNKIIFPTTNVTNFIHILTLNNWRFYCILTQFM